MSPLRRIALVLHLDYAWGRALARGIARFVLPDRPWEFIRLKGQSGIGAILNAGGFDGVIAQVWPDIVLEVSGLKIPAVDLSDVVDHGVLPVVSVDSRAVGQMAAEYLLSLGHLRLAYVSRGDSLASRMRCSGFCEAVEAVELSRQRRRAPHNRRPPAQVTSLVNRSYQAVEQWLSQQIPPVGVFVFDDQQAEELSRACRRLELRIPEDVALIGAGNDRTICELANPPLTSIDQPGERVGYEAARLLDAMMQGEPPATMQVRLPPIRIVPRRSTSAVAIGDPALREVLQTMHDRIEQLVSVNQLVREAAVSRRWLERKCLDLLGHGPAEELTRIRIERAKALLAEPELSLLDIALRCGLSNQSRLSIIFRRETGMTPSAYRRERNGVKPTTAGNIR